MQKLTSLGTEYGKHYVNIELINKDSIVYSFGIGEDVSFDLELIKLTNCNIYGFDPTPKAIKYVQKNINLNNFTFFEYGLSNIDGELTFSSPNNPEHASYKENINGSINFPVKKLSSILKELNHTKIDLLKLDIEGSEYSVINNFLEENILPQQIAVEFHRDTNSIVEWIKNNKLLKKHYTGSAYPNQNNQNLEAHFSLRD